MKFFKNQKQKQQQVEFRRAAELDAIVAAVYRGDPTLSDPAYLAEQLGERPSTVWALHISGKVTFPDDVLVKNAAAAASVIAAAISDDPRRADQFPMDALFASIGNSAVRAEAFGKRLGCSGRAALTPPVASRLADTLDPLRRAAWFQEYATRDEMEVLTDLIKREVEAAKAWA